MAFLVERELESLVICRTQNTLRKRFLWNDLVNQRRLRRWLDFLLLDSVRTCKVQILLSMEVSSYIVLDLTRRCHYDESLVTSSVRLPLAGSKELETVN